MRCAFCGHVLQTHAPEEKKCGSCHGGCAMLKCPWCGYGMPREPGLVKWFKNMRSNYAGRKN